jgi:hypothetical protein
MSMNQPLSISVRNMIFGASRLSMPLTKSALSMTPKPPADVPIINATLACFIPWFFNKSSITA